MPLSFLGAFAIALFTSVLLMPLMERLGFRLGAVSRPGGRNVHMRATSRFIRADTAMATVMAIMATTNASRS